MTKIPPTPLNCFSFLLSSFPHALSYHFFPFLSFYLFALSLSFLQLDENSELHQRISEEAARIERENRLLREQLREGMGDAFQLKGHQSTKETLIYSLMGNVAITLFKFFAYARTGHSAMFTEAVHTLVDVANQCILAWGWREADRSPDSKHQYGYGRAAFFYSLLASLSTFGFGSLYTFYQGVHNIVSPQPELLADHWTWAVLSLSLTVDGIVLRKALLDAVNRARQAKMTTVQWILAFKVKKKKRKKRRKEEEEKKKKKDEEEK
jgi:zinc transporter 9